MRERVLGAVARLASIGVLPSDSDGDRLRKATLTLSTALISIAGIIWGATYAALGLWRAAIFPAAYSVLSTLNLLYFVVTKRYVLFRFGQLLLILLVPLLLQASLGGFTSSGGVVLWALMAPLGALMFHGSRQALVWLLGFLAIAVASAILEGTVSTMAPPASPSVSAGFFAMNVTGVSTVIYLLMRYSVREKEEAQERSERLLINILPKPIADRLKRDPTAIADGYAEVTVLFADIVDFTKFSSGVPPQELVAVLNDVFSEFDELAERYGLEKIKTIGDAYMVVGGLPNARPDHAEAVAGMALEMHEALALCAARTGTPLKLRIGIHIGPVVAGVIGRKKFIYDLWGDTVNTASRMESHGLPGSIQVTQEAYERLRGRFVFQDRGLISIKGKGEMAVYLLLGRKSSAEVQSEIPHGPVVRA